MPPHVHARKQQSQQARAFKSLRLQMLAAYKELDRKCDQLTRGQPRRVHHLLRAVVQLFKARGSQHVQLYLGPAALSRTGWQSRSSHKRAKRQALDIRLDQDGNTVEGLGLLRRTHQGGGRLRGREKDESGRYRGNADGVMVGPAITGWAPEQYDQLAAGPPEVPDAAQPLAREEGETVEAWHERNRRHRAYLEQRGYDPG